MLFISPYPVTDASNSPVKLRSSVARTARSSFETPALHDALEAVSNSEVEYGLKIVTQSLQQVPYVLALMSTY